MKKTIRRKITSLIVCLSILFGGLNVLSFGGLFKANAQSSSENKGYFYLQLSEKEKAFYGALDTMNTQGLFKTNAAYDLVKNNVVSDVDVQEYADGNNELLKQFANAKDAYELDHPEVFYVDFETLDLSFGKKSDGKFTATIDAGRDSSYLIYGLTTETVQTAIDFLNGDDGLKTLLPTEEDLTEEQKIKAVHQNILENAENVYVKTEASNYLNTAYGLLKFGIASAEGYAETFKLCMNAIGVESVVVHGYLASGTENSLSAHAWNYVKLEQNWFAVDAASNDKNLVNNEEFFLSGSDSFNTVHIEDNKISFDGKQFGCPSLITENFNLQNFEVQQVYEENNLKVKISYNGKSASKLKQDENLYMVVAYSYSSVPGSQIFFDFYNDLSGTQDESETQTVLSVENRYAFVKIGVTTVAPDDGTAYTGLTNKDLICYEIVANTNYATNANETLPSATITAKNILTNQTVQNAQNTALTAGGTWEIELDFGTELRKLVDNLDVNVSVSSLEDEVVYINCLIEDVEWSADNSSKIKFKFTPSELCAHKKVSYIFAVRNLCEKEVSKNLNYATLKFDMPVSIGYRYHAGDRIVVQNYTVPELIDNGSLDIVNQGWKDMSNNSFLKSEQSQLTLVGLKVDTDLEKTMVDPIKDSLEIADDDLFVYDCFDFTLDINGKVQEIPNGSYVNMVFGYPKGYSFESLKNNVEFFVYQYNPGATHEIDYTTPIKLDAVATENGLFVSVNKISSFVVFATEKSDSTNKLVYSRTINNKGEIECSNELNALKKVTSISEGTLDYLITPDNGYKIDYVLLNGKDVTDKVVDSHLTLTFEELSKNNVVEVAFVSIEVANKELSEGITNLSSDFAENQKMVYVRQQPNETSEKNNTWMIVLIVAGSVVFAAAATTISIVVIKKKSLKK